MSVSGHTKSKNNNQSFIHSTETTLNLFSCQYLHNPKLFYPAKYIPNCTKIRKGKAEQTSESFKESDDYVLSKLFKAKKKNGGQSYIHTALQHDKVLFQNF